MEILIYIYYDYKANNLKAFKTNSKNWLNHKPNRHRIMFSHSLKLYAKNFDCTQAELEKLISTAKTISQGDGYVANITI